MKTKFFLSALTLGAMMTTFVACDKEEPYVDPDKVIESEVINPGTAEEVTEKDNGTEGTFLSYETWIVVYQVFADGSTLKRETRALESDSYGNKISVILENTMTHVSATTDVTDFEMKKAVNSVEYRELGSAKYPKQQFVTVIDSATVYTVDRDIFTVEFVLPYQVAVYDDGITKVTMPYHKYSDIVDNGGEISDLENEVSAGKTYQRKLYKHSITAEFNGKAYTVNAEIILRKELVGDYLVSRKIVGEGVDLVSYDLSAKTGVSKSWIKIEENWSLSGTKTTTKEVLLYNGLPEESYRHFCWYLNSKPPYSSLKVGGLKSSVSDYGERKDGNFAIVKHLHDFQVPVESLEMTNARYDYVFGVTFETAVYSEGDFEYEMPSLGYANVRCTMSLVEDWHSRENNPTEEVMNLRFACNVSFGNVWYDFSGNGEICFLVKQ